MIARQLYQSLPYRLQTSIYERLIRPRRRDFGHWFKSAPLKFAPSVRMNLSPGDSFHGNIAFCGVYEAEETALIDRWAAGPGGLLVDVGANYGYYTLLWCAAHPDNRVVAIEAAPKNARALHENVRRNGFEGRVRILECAVSREDGETDFELGSDEETGWGGIAAGTGTAIKVPCRRLDHLLNEPVTVLKVDCEGADAWVIEGAKGLIDQDLIAHVVFEENPWRQERLGIEKGAACRLLQKAGYSVCGLGPGPDFSNFHAERATR